MTRGGTGTIRLSCGDHSFPVLPHEQTVELVRMLGFDAFDLAVMGNRSHARPEGIREDISGWAGRLEERIRGRGLDIADVFCSPWTDFATDGAEQPGRGGTRPTMVPGVDWPHEHHDSSLERAAQELGRRAAESRAAGVRFSIEPHVGSVCGTPEDVARLVELAPGLELTLDYTHYVSQGFSEEQLEPLVRHARHVHARGGAPGRFQCALKDRTINYGRLVDALRASGYDGAVALDTSGSISTSTAAS